MQKSAARLLLLVSVFVSACAAAGREAPEPAMPEPPPRPEPVLVRHGDVFAYDTGNGVLASIGGPDSVPLEVALDRVTVRVRTPPGWRGSYAGEAAWFERESGSTRFVVYPVRDHVAEFRDLWYARDTRDSAVRVGPVQSFDSPRHPLLYTYERTDDGRRGIVYALLSVPGDPASGILVHGSWPAEQDRELRPIAVAAANGASIAPR